MLRALLEGVGELDEGRLAPGATHEGQADWQTPGVARRDGDEWVTRHRGWRRAGTHEVVAVDQVDGPGRAAGWCDERVEVVLVHDRVDAFGAGETVARGERLKVGSVGER